MKKRTLRVSAGRSCRTLLILALGCLAVTATAQQRYRLTMYPTPEPGFTSTSVAAVNDSNRFVFGGFGLRTGLNGTVTTMPPLAGFIYGPSGVSINASGFVAGTARTTSSNVSTNRVFRYDPNTAVTTNMGTLPPASGTTFFRSDARSINGAGVIVGSARTASASSSQRAALFSTPGAPVNLASTGFVNDSSSAEDINDSNQIVGFGKLTGQTSDQPLLFDGAGGATTFPILPGDLGGRAFGINNLGVVVGQSNGLTQDTRKAVVWVIGSPGLVQLSRPAGIDSSTTAADINESGVIIGNGLVGGITSRALVWFGTDGHDLNTLVVNPIPDFLVATPTDINNSGVIVGSSLLDGSLRGYVLQPVLSSSHFAITTTQGQYLSGGIAEIAGNNNQRYLVLGSETDPTIEVEVQSTSPVNTPSVFTVEIESSSVYSALSQYVELWDNAAGAWTPVSYSVPGLTDAIASADFPTNGARFVRASDGLIRTRARWIPFNDLAQAVDGWSVGIDAVYHSVLP